MAELTAYDQITSTMAELEEALESNIPGFANILKKIHQDLAADPDVVTLLTPEQISVVVRGLERHAGIIVTPAKAKKAAAKKNISAADL